MKTFRENMTVIIFFFILKRLKKNNIKGIIVNTQKRKLSIYLSLPKDSDFTITKVRFLLEV